MKDEAGLGTVYSALEGLGGISESIVDIEDSDCCVSVSRGV